MNRRVLALVVAAAAAAALVFFLIRGSSDGGGDAPETDAPGETATVKVARRAAPEQGAAADSAGPNTTQVVMDADPVGTLRLEGQVIDGFGAPVPGATVYLNARPPRTATSADDGSFAFEKLVGRSYAVSARSGDLVGGPVVYQLTADSDPVIVRVSEGASLEVTVVAADDGRPVAGATSHLTGMADLAATTDDQGVARLRGVPAGWTFVVTRAAGYGTARTAVQIPEGTKAPLPVRVELARGTSVSGRVIDSAGAPVANARVVARGADQPFAPINVFADGVTTDDKGAFTIDGLAFGSYRFLAFHDRYAPGSSDHVSVSAASQPRVEIALEEGAAIAGRVVDAGGAPAPWAQVNVTTDPGTRGFWGGSVSRQVVAGEDGRFEIGGLPRTPVSAHARTDEASSEPASIDLKAVRVVDDVELRLTVVGVISGVVVDEVGEPVAEIQVMAQPDFWGGQSADGFAGGTAFASTDGGGRFAIRGLPEGGVYLLRASRSEMTAQRALGKPSKAEVGDTDVEIVLARDGGVKGTIVTQDGSPPEVAVVSIAWAAGAPAIDGDFSLQAIPPGTYDVTVRGASFPPRVVKDVTVEPGKVRDLGTIKVERGRAVRGKVVDQRGRPVEGAQVVVGRQIVGDGANLLTSIDDATAMQMGIRRTVTGDGGQFTIAGLGDDEVAVAAEHPERGRSLPISVPTASGDATVDLVLLPFGSVRGTVLLNGEPAADVSVLLTATVGARQILASRSGLDGGFLFDRVAAGSYKATAMLGGGASAQMASKQITVVGGEELTVELGITTGDIKLSVVIAGKDGAKVDAAQVFLFGNPEIDAKTGAEINQLFLSASQAGDGKMAFSMAGAPAVFDKLTPGDYSMCIIPITGDMNDPTFAQRLQQSVDTIAVYCHAMTVAGSPKEQTYNTETPAMTPLPE